MNRRRVPTIIHGSTPIAGMWKRKVVLTISFEYPYKEDDRWISTRAQVYFLVGKSIDIKSINFTFQRLARVFAYLHSFLVVDSETHYIQFILEHTHNSRSCLTHLSSRVPRDRYRRINSFLALFVQVILFYFVSHVCIYIYTQIVFEKFPQSHLMCFLKAIIFRNNLSTQEKRQTVDRL